MLTRRQLLKGAAAGAAAAAAAGPIGLLAAPSGAAPANGDPRAGPLPPLRKWTDPCPTPGASWPVIDLRTAGATSVVATQFTVGIHADLPPTTVWGYEQATGAPVARSTYLGPTLLAQRGTPVEVTFRNELPAVPLFPTDPALVPHGTVDSRINTHLHGGRIAAGDDGNPLEAYTGGSPEVLRGGSQTRTYANEQGGALLWYHDHAPASPARTSTRGWPAGTSCWSRAGPSTPPGTSPPRWMPAPSPIRMATGTSRSTSRW